MTTVSTQPAPTRDKTRIADRLRASPVRARSFTRRERSSVVVGGLVGIYLLVVAIRLPWADDLMLHMAVLERLLADPLHPGNPVVDVGGSSVYYSPYMVVLALLGKPLGLSAYTLCKAAAVVDVVLLLTGLYRFVRTLSQARWAPPFVLAGMLLWWGTFVVSWSGFMGLVSLGDTEAFPSTLATALTLHLWAWLNDGRTLQSAKRMGWMGALLGLILLIHEFTGLSALFGVAAIFLARIVVARQGDQRLRDQRQRDQRTKAALRALAVGLAACVLVIVVWPYYHLWSVGPGQLGYLDPVHKPLYSDVITWYGLGIALGVVALALRWRRNNADALLPLMFLGIGAVVAYGWLTQHWSYGRSWPMLMLVLQIAAAIELAEAKPGRARWAWGVPVAAATMLGLISQSGSVFYVVPTSWQASVTSVLADRPFGPRLGVEDLPHLAWLGDYVKPGQVVAADSEDSQFEIAAHGAYCVALPWYMPEISPADNAARAAASSAIFSPNSSTAEREAAFAEYHVQWVLLVPRERLPQGFQARLVAHGNGYTLYQAS